MTEQRQQAWDAYWTDRTPTSATPTMSRVLDRIKLEYLAPVFPPGQRLLEVGCGSGRLSTYLAAAGRSTVCLDISLAALDAARRNYRVMRLRGRFVAADAFHLPFADGTFDGVLSTGLLEHFVEPVPIVREMVRVLRRGGTLYADIVPRKFSLFRSLECLARIKRAGGGAGEGPALYERSFTPGEIQAMLDQAGLVDATVFPAGVVPPYLPVLYRSRWLREAQVRLIERTQGFWKALDATWIAERLGFYYFVRATKPGTGA